MRNTVRRYLRSETTEPAYAERQTASCPDPYAHQLAGWLKTEAAKSRKQRRSLKQLHEELVDLGFKGSYDRVAAFARRWRKGQTEWLDNYQFCAQTNKTLPHIAYGAFQCIFDDRFRSSQAGGCCCLHDAAAVGQLFRANHAAGNIHPYAAVADKAAARIEHRFAADL